MANSTNQEYLQIDQDPKLSRRNFLKVGIGALSALAVMEVGGAGFFFLQARSQEGEFGEIVPAARFFLIRAPDGGFLAVHNRCPHLGCAVTWVPQEEKFLCPCHASTFDFYGNFESPPVPRPLDTFAVQIEDGKVMVDTTQLAQREQFAPAQLAYASS